MIKLTSREKRFLIDLISGKISEIEDEVEERKFQLTGMKAQEIQAEEDEIKWLKNEKLEWKEILKKIRKIKVLQKT